MEEQVYPLAVLIDELKHEDASTRITAMERLSTVALALGDERSRDELVPFLSDVAKEDEDEILTLMAEQLGSFTQYLGGPEYAWMLLEPLSALVICEEPIVRDTAISSMSNLAREMDTKQLQEHFVPLVLKLATSEWFSSRIGAAGLYPVTMECSVEREAVQQPEPVEGEQRPPRKVGAPKKNALRYTLESLDDLLTDFALLASDDAPMVRRATGLNFPQVITNLPNREDAKKLLPVFLNMVQDSQDSVKLLAVDAAIALADLDPRDLKLQITEPVFALLDDKSWRVRYQSADRFAALAVALGDVVPGSKPAGSHEVEEFRANTHRHMLDTFVHLTGDPEGEVRTAVSKQLVDYVRDQLSEEEVITRVVPCLESLTSDISEGVREALAGKIAGIAPKLGKENTIKYLLPLFLDMLRDEHSEVRLQIISHLDVINDIIGIDRLSESLLPAIGELAKDKQWRVLLAVIDYSPLLAQQLGVDFFNKELVPLVFNWLWDPVWAIRDAAAENLKKLAGVFGIQWLEEEIVPKLVSLPPNSNYLYRLTALLSIKKIVLNLTPHSLITVVIPFVVDMSNDPVPNVRFNSASTMGLITERIGMSHSEVIETSVAPVVARLTEDPDVDVRFFASEAQKLIPSPE